MEQKRLFVAIKIKPDKEFLRYYHQLKKALQQEKIKWVDEGNMHFTLKFLGETPVDFIEEIIDALQEARLGIMPFNMVLEGMGIFGSSYEPRVIWYGIRDETQIFNLADNIFSELEGIGIERDRQNFVPHLSIGRIKQLNDKEKFQQIIDKHKPGLIQTIRVVEFSLIESVLQPSGPTYYILESFNL